MTQLPPDLLDLKRRGYGSEAIDEHRAFRRIPNRQRVSWGAVLLVVVLTAGTLVSLPQIAAFWRWLLGFVAPPVGFANQLGSRTRTILPFIKLQVPYIAATAPLPTPRVWSMSAVATAAVLVVSFYLPRNWLPLAYFLRAVVLIQAIALAYFAVFGPSFPYTLAAYTSDMYTIGLAIIAVVPMVFGLTYFVFDFGVVRKITIVLLTIVHLILFIPLQYLLHAALVKSMSLLFLPVLYMLFGALPDISVLIAMYGWGMSWRDRAERVRGEKRTAAPADPAADQAAPAAPAADQAAPAAPAADQ